MLQPVAISLLISLLRDIAQKGKIRGLFVDREGTL